MIKKHILHIDEYVIIKPTISCPCYILTEVEMSFKTRKKSILLNLILLFWVFLVLMISTVMVSDGPNGKLKYSEILLLSLGQHSVFLFYLMLCERNILSHNGLKLS